eukprot:1161946-Pelagomonas_calceolata.AAC.4
MQQKVQLGARLPALKKGLELAASTLLLYTFCARVQQKTFHHENAHMPGPFCTYTNKRSLTLAACISLGCMLPWPRAQGSRLQQPSVQAALAAPCCPRCTLLP